MSKPRKKKITVKLPTGEKKSVDINRSVLIQMRSHDIMHEMYLTNKNEGHNKFYEMKIEKAYDEDGDDFFKLTKRWGRIGTKGQKKVEKYDTLNGAKTMMKKTQIAKERKGYVTEKSKVQEKEEEISGLAALFT